MQIKYKGGDKFEIKSKDLEIVLSKDLVINGFTFPGPGEYEKSGVIVSGIADQENTIYILNLEEMSVCYLDHINHDLNDDEIKQIGAVDILFVPLGEDGSADLKIATKLISKIDPRIVIPMLFADLTEFQKNEGSTESIDILKIRKVDLPQEERRVVILETS